MASWLSHPDTRSWPACERSSFSLADHERFASMTADELNKVILEVASKSLKPYMALSMPFQRLSAEQRGTLALVLAERSPRVVVDCIRELKIENRDLLWEIAQKIARLHPSAFIVGLPFFELDVAQRREIFKRISSYELSYITHFAKFALPEEAFMQTALEIAEADPESVATRIARLGLGKKERQALMEAVLHKSPAVFASYFHEFGFSKDVVWAGKWLDIGLSLPLEAYRPYYRQVQEAAIRTDLPVLSAKEIIIGGSVIADGLGDYMNMLSLARAIHAKFLGQKLRLIVKVDKDHYEETAHVISPPNWLSLEVMFSSVKDLPPPALEKVLLSGYTVVLEPMGGGSFPHIGERLSLLEPGGGLGLGLRDEDYGLLLPDLREVPSDPSAISLEDIRELVRKALEANDVLGVLYFNDVEDGVASLVLKALELATWLTDKKRDVTYLTNIEIDEHTIRSLERHYSTVEIVSKRGVKRIISEKAEKRRIRLMTTALILHQDMLIIKKLVNSPIIGCTGDQSLAEALASCKEQELFLYQVRRHKRGLAAQYHCLADKLLAKDDPYPFFLKHYEHMTAEELLGKVDFGR